MAKGDLNASEHKASDAELAAAGEKETNEARDSGETFEDDEAAEHRTKKSSKKKSKKAAGGSAGEEL